MNTRHCILGAGAILAAVTIGQASRAAEAGRVLFANGNVQIVGANGNSRPAKRGDIVQEGERLLTGAGSLGQVQMTDGGRVGVRGESNVRFDPPASGGNPPQLTLERGNVRVLNVAGRGQNAPQPVEIKTPDGDLLMRNADVVVGLADPGGGQAGPVSVRVNSGEGKMDVKGATEPLALAPGGAIAITRGKAEALATPSGDLERPASTRGDLRPSDDAISQRLTAIPAGAKDGPLKAGGFTRPPAAGFTSAPTGGLRTPSITGAGPVFVPLVAPPTIASLPKSQLSCALQGCGTLSVAVPKDAVLTTNTLTRATGSIDALLAPKLTLRTPLPPADTLTTTVNKPTTIDTKSALTSKETGIISNTTISNGGVTTIKPTTIGGIRTLRR